ncbi:MCE family protein [Allokutzneria albata]|uniref:Phospholipid/cholesterol/gamma-HCH transport system substrate-binding protein n=1 Tax=Allokutzneria albata TaxID=211114 RepID=A0A1G9URE7_ALLAB|nr:MCE family protein [Allokutzneria albata]SDM62444.1 phospholipid/cholesterol/gamma-HCH transport system substrate-binding protein [Allokutzneria albata]
MRRALALLAVLLLTAGCVGAYDIPLPGGADVGSKPYRVTAQFRDVLDLVPQAAVKVNDVAVGRVESIDLAEDEWTADVRLVLNGDVRLPANAVAQLRQTSLLGEKYVELAHPREAPTGTLADGAVVPVERSGRNPEVEEVFGALAMVLNGGGVAQLRDITRELNAALGGNEKEIRSLLSTVEAFVRGLDQNRGKITAALDGVKELSTTLNARREPIGVVLDKLEPGLKVFAEQRESLTTMLKALDRLSGVAVRTINASKDDAVAGLRALEPTLRRLAEAGQKLPQALEVLLTYPFPDSALDAIKGDYLNVFLTLVVPR